MKHVRWLAAILGSCLAAQELPAQNLVLIPSAPAVLAGPFGIGGADIGLSYRRKHVVISINSAGFGGCAVSSYAFSPYLAGPGCLSVFPGPAVGGIFVPQPFIAPLAVLPPSNQDFEARVVDMVARQRAMLDPVPPREGDIMVKIDRKPAEDRPLPGQEAGQFRPIRPEDREKAKLPFKGDDARPRKGNDDARPIPGQDIDPKTPVGRFILLGREAYSQEGYGRAVLRFRQASEADGNNADAHLLLGQALCATGKYRDAAAELQHGLLLNPNWPRAAFRPLEMYGPNVADFSLHIQALEDALALQPNDVDLLFLLGYERWFDGRKEEAERLFRRALRQAPNNGAFGLFLNQAPGLPIV